MAKKLTLSTNPEKKNLTGGLNNSEISQQNKDLKEEIAVE